MRIGCYGRMEGFKNVRMEGWFMSELDLNDRKVKKLSGISKECGK